MTNDRQVNISFPSKPNRDITGGSPTIGQATMKYFRVLCVDTQLYNLRNNRVFLPFYIFGIFVYSAAKESNIKGRLECCSCNRNPAMLVTCYDWLFYNVQFWGAAFWYGSTSLGRHNGIPELMRFWQLVGFSFLCFVSGALEI